MFLYMVSHYDSRNYKKRWLNLNRAFFLSLGVWLYFESVTNKAETETKAALHRTSVWYSDIRITITAVYWPSSERIMQSVKEELCWCDRACCKGTSIATCLKYPASNRQPEHCWQWHTMTFTDIYLHDVLCVCVGVCVDVWMCGLFYCGRL